LQVTRQTLDTGWRVREIAAPGIPEFAIPGWLPAQVPGHVHLDLMRAGVIPDPFQRLYERDVAWVAENDWEYETTFTVEEPLPATAYLLFHGLDTVAEITLNGEPLAQTDNMYIPHEFPVGGKLRAGENQLSVIFRSALRVGRERLQAWDDPAVTTPPFPADWDRWAARSFVRKAQYMFGWDWGPVLPSSGLWRPVELVTVPVARLGDWKHSVEFTEDGKAVVTVEAEIERSTDATDTPLTFTAEFTGVGYREEDFSDSMPAPVTVTVTPGETRASVSLTLENPRRWNPAGLNSDTQFDGSHPPLYTLEMSLLKNTDTLESKTAQIGLRTIELIREPDADGQGEGFKFRVNGEDVFIKGANWIPEDSFPSRLENEPDALDFPQDDRVRQRIEDACNAGMNMLRVWGGGLYESEHFYELCDAHGILVWQDFPYGCAYYPDTGEYADAGRREATAAVKRIRNHASIALWCGNNENQVMYEGPWGGVRPARYLGEKLYFDILPAVVAAEDPKTPYWPSSPFGGEPKSNSEDYGDCHNWDVWHGRGDWKHYTENNSRFCSEFGFAASCGLRAWDSVLAPDDRHPLSPAVRWHDKTRKGYDTYLGFISLHYPDAQTLEDLVYFSQINQAEALKYGVEHYRRRKGRCWGTLFWQLNDCWPVQSWAIIDSLGDPRAAYYACQKFYAPVLVSLVHTNGAAEAHLVSDRLTAIAGTLTFTLQTFDGETLAEAKHEVTAALNSASVVASFDLKAAGGQERDVFLHARFDAADGEENAAENFLFFAEPKDWRVSDPGLTVNITEQDETFVVTLQARRFAPYVWLRRSDNAPLFPTTDMGDNFFHLRPGETRELWVPKTEDMETVEALRGMLTVRTL
jgi:beta-mannosidase